VLADDKALSTEPAVTEMSGAEIANGATQSSEPTNQAGALLHASRRVDWRFLLPEPILKDVLCVQPVSQTLAEALQIFSAALASLEPGTLGDERQPHLYDVVVALDPSKATLSRMATLVKPGGYIYLEAHGLTSLLRSSQRAARAGGVAGAVRQRGPWLPKAYKDALQALDFSEPQSHWHWPDFENCKMMIPLESPAAVQHAFHRGGHGLKTQLRTGLGRVLLRSGLLAWTVPCFSVLARREVL